MYALTYLVMPLTCLLTGLNIEYIVSRTLTSYIISIIVSNIIYAFYRDFNHTSHLTILFKSYFYNKHLLSYLSSFCNSPLISKIMFISILIPSHPKYVLSLCYSVLLFLVTLKFYHIVLCPFCFS